MKLTEANLTEVNGKFTRNTVYNWLTNEYDTVAPFADGGLYLPLSPLGVEVFEAKGVLDLIDGGPFVMVVGGWEVPVDDECARFTPTGFAIQFFSKVMPGMMSGYETFDSFVGLTEYLTEHGVDVASDGWLGARRGW